MSFTFKKFSITDDHCAQKVSTDGVLLGAWTTWPSKCQRILDIGSGSGLLSLMAAQRSEAEIIGIELDYEAYCQAKENAKYSPWNKRINFIHTDIRDYTPTSPFNCIISNPPFFKESLLPPNERRRLAHSAQSLPFSDLMKCAARMLSPNGLFHIIVPTNTEREITLESTLQQLHLVRRCEVFPTPKKDSRRLLLTFSPHFEILRRSSLILLDEYGKRSSEFAELTKDFYL